MMKRSIFTLILISLYVIVAVAQEGQVQKNDPVGKWIFQLPDAPEGYKSGTIDVGFTGEKYSASMFFTEREYKIPGEKVSFLQDSLLFVMYAEGQEITVSLKLTEPLKMEGKVVYSEGEIPLFLTKESKPD